MLADSDEWGGETPLLMALAEQLAQGAPIVMVLAGGGAGTRVELLEGVARGWPLLVVEGTGGIADEVVAALRSAQPVGKLARLLRGRRRREPSPLLRELEGGDVRIVSGDGPKELRRSLLWELQYAPALKDAWRLFATYDGLAERLSVTHERFQASILLLGVAATLAALLSFETKWPSSTGLAIAVPIVASVVIALANRRATGKRWVLLRAAAEAIKSEIYRYRTATGVYATQALRHDGASAQLRLVDRLADIDAKLVRTEASGASIPPYDGPLPPDMYGAEAGDDGISPLDAARYVDFRIADQLAYYRGKVGVLDRRRGGAARRAAARRRRGRLPCRRPPRRSGSASRPPSPGPRSATSATSNSTARSSPTTRPPHSSARSNASSARASARWSSRSSSVAARPC